jgi:N6-L-threonylcarbamoyladenine synthase
VALLVSGGSYRALSGGRPEGEPYRELGATRDDAAGEAFDKVGKLLGLGYPAARSSTAWRAKGTHAHPIPAAHEPQRFAGVQLLRPKNQRRPVRRAARQAAKRSVSARTSARFPAARRGRSSSEVTQKPSTKSGWTTWVIGGGVAANAGLRTAAASAAAERAFGLVVPIPRACTDNAAMIAFAGSRRCSVGRK